MIGKVSENWWTYFKPPHPSKVVPPVIYSAGPLPIYLWVHLTCFPWSCEALDPQLLPCSLWWMPTFTSHTCFSRINHLEREVMVFVKRDQDFWLTSSYFDKSKINTAKTETLVPSVSNKSTYRPYFLSSFRLSTGEGKCKDIQRAMGSFSHTN